MKARNRPIRGSEHPQRENEQVRKQMRIFIAALQSYPRRFAEDRGVSFEEHRRKLLKDVIPGARRGD